MTEAEQKMFKKLEQEYGNQYYIFPQINLDKLIEVTDEKNFYHYFNQINRRSVDFVLADKQTLETKQLIELDDSTHLQQKRKQRDQFVNQLLSKLNIVVRRINL